ncbi:MAG: ribonuclease HII [Atopobiaceae bacterium]|jgi:ribonuclease HII|nr:ribonuclease HII [Atopobiaceae bacterium]MCI2173171.1 ribonuclease HII [Atopobiaceae bacterium]MCI2208264.1 ribonuclease HII [Atopobiaceae bacterium]
MGEGFGSRAASAREVIAVLAQSSLEELPSAISRYSDDPRKQVRQAVTSATHRLERETADHERVRGMYELQRELGGEGLVIGVDEVGRGAVAGPLTVAAVALPMSPMIWGVNDSKQLTPHKREILSEQIRHVALCIGICHVEPATIDAVGMSASLRYAMSHAIADAGIEPDAVLIDGNPVHAHPKERTLVKGDARIACIAAASIVAKVTRDAMMVEYDALYPGYHLAESKGYASADHIAAIREHGLTDIHRASFCGNFLDEPRLF